MEVRIQCPYHLLNLLRCTDFTFCPSQHHYKEPNLGFGVTSPVWDRIFNTTFVSPGQVQKAAAGK
jgi:hypothetical protein